MSKILGVWSMWEHMFRRARSYVPTHTEGKGRHQASPSVAVRLMFQDIAFLWAWSSPTQLDWPALRLPSSILLPPLQCWSYRCAPLLPALHMYARGLNSDPRLPALATEDCAPPPSLKYCPLRLCALLSCPCFRKQKTPPPRSPCSWKPFSWSSGGHKTTTKQQQPQSREGRRRAVGNREGLVGIEEEQGKCGKWPKQVIHVICVYEIVKDHKGKFEEQQVRKQFVFWANQEDGEWVNHLIPAARGVGRRPKRNKWLSLE